MTAFEPRLKLAVAAVTRDVGVASCHLDLSAYNHDEIPFELYCEGYGGVGLAGSDDYREPE